MWTLNLGMSPELPVTSPAEMWICDDQDSRQAPACTAEGKATESIPALRRQSGTLHDTHAEVVLANRGRSACGLLVTMLENLGSCKAAPVIQDAPRQNSNLQAPAWDRFSSRSEVRDCAEATSRWASCREARLPSANWTGKC